MPMHVCRNMFSNRPLEGGRMDQTYIFGDSPLSITDLYVGSCARIASEESVKPVFFLFFFQFMLTLVQIIGINTAQTEALL